MDFTPIAPIQLDGSAKNELLILDEPTSAMDKEDSAVLWKYLNECKNKKIIIVITHKRDEIEHADVVLNMGTGV